MEVQKQLVVILNYLWSDKQGVKLGNDSGLSFGTKKWS